MRGEPNLTEYVNRNDAFAANALVLRESEGRHRKNSLVTAHVSQEKSPLPSTKESPLSLCFSVVDTLPHLPATFFLFFFSFFFFFLTEILLLELSARELILLIGHLMPESEVPGFCNAHILRIGFYERLRPPRYAIRIPDVGTNSFSAR